MGYFDPLSDNSTAQEELKEYRHPQYFSYTVKNFTGILRLLTTSADGKWWFDSKTAGETHIKWKYAFNSRSIFALAVLWFITNFFWHG